MNEKKTRHSSIHVSEEALKMILSDSLESNGIQMGKKLEPLVKDIMQKAWKYQLTKRKILGANKKDEIKLQKIVSSSKADTHLFAQVLSAIRKSKRHRGVTPIAEGSRDWILLKEITALAQAFCNDFGLESKEGYTEYINWALNLMDKKFFLNRFKGFHQRITDIYAAKVELKEYNEYHVAMTHEAYQTKVFSRTGLMYSYKDQPDQYIFFAYSHKEANRLGISIQHYLEAQFFGLEWAKAIPEPRQLVGPKAIERLSKYLNKVNIKLKPKSSTPSIDFSKLKEL